MLAKRQLLINIKLNTDIVFKCLNDLKQYTLNAENFVFCSFQGLDLCWTLITSSPQGGAASPRELIETLTVFYHKTL